MKLLLIAHGSRDPRYAASFDALLRRLRREGHAGQVGYLELCGPGVVEAALRLARETVRPCAGSAAPGPARDEQIADERIARDERIAAVPMFLNRGYHVAHDVPAAVAEARAAVSSVARITVAAPLGPDPLLTEAMESRLRELGVWPGDPETAVVLASAGTSDRAARGVLEVVAARWAETGWHSVIPAYAAAAEPDVADALARARSAGARRAVVASYFLAPGRLADRVAVGADGTAMAAPFITPESVDPALLRLVLQRAGEAVAAASAPEASASARSKGPHIRHPVGALRA